jgi:hypothetical protein
MELNKWDIQKLINTKSERLTYENVNGKSEVWKQFVGVKVDDRGVNYVKYLRYFTALKWHTHDGTNSLKMHIRYFATKIPHTKSTSTDTELPPNKKARLVTSFLCDIFSTREPTSADSEVSYSCHCKLCEVVG